VTSARHARRSFRRPQQATGAIMVLLVVLAGTQNRAGQPIFELSPAPHAV